VSGTIGVRRRRVDGEAKVRGTTRYAADLPVPDILHARLVLSSEAHALIGWIDYASAVSV
jgi:CO/xanthine dehydrogenase Mo-binding subunit